MTKIGYMSDLESTSPRSSLENAMLAERVGFQMIAAADHFYPWIHTGKTCAFAWVWLASVAAVTNKVVIGSAVTSPILRYNPAIIAQAFATMEAMYPSRVFLGLGAGEAINEVPAGYKWPSAAERVKRLEEALIIITKLWAENTVSFDGEYFRLTNARLYTKPTGHIPVVLAAGKRRTAELAGRYADALLTVPQLFSRELIDAFENEARRVGRDPSRLEKHLNFGVSFDEDYDRAMAACKPLGATILPFIFEYGITDPQEVEKYSQFIDEKELAKMWLITTNPEDCLKAVEKYVQMGFTHFHIQSISPKEDDFIRMVGKNVIPYFR